MNYPLPRKFIRYVADKSLCQDLGGADAAIEIALDWLREKIIQERNRLDALYEREENKRIAPEE